MDRSRPRVVILGAAGRDFHDFNCVFRDDPSTEVVAFTAAQIPGIEGRRYPASLAGPRYPEGIPIVAESELETLVSRGVTEVVLSYSDLSHASAMHLASRALASGASFRLLAPELTMLQGERPVIAVTAVRTGCGKSQVARHLARLLRGRGERVAVIRHPMPYGRDLEAQRSMRFASSADLDRYEVTIEEREDYEPHIVEGSVVFAGVDYGEVLAAAEREASIVVWDGGNNDTPFVRPDLWITVVDPHRAGHELAYHPGETNLRRADVVVVNKVDSAPERSVAALVETVARVRPSAPIVKARSAIAVDDPDLVRGRRVLCVEDGPTVTHGEMPFGAATVAARRLGAAELVDPRPHATGSLRETFARYPHIGPCLPAVGYSPSQVRDLEATIARVPCDAVLVGSPFDLAALVPLPVPSTRVRYELEDAGDPTLGSIVASFLERKP